MVMKLIGAGCVIAGCGCVGFRIAACHRQEEKYLRQLVSILDYMTCELQYRMTPLPELCRRAATEFPNVPGVIFMELANRMDARISPDIDVCMSSALEKYKQVPQHTRAELELLGKSVGRFDLTGQLQGLAAVRQDCVRILEELSADRDVRLRSYQTLGLCAGAALAILFV